MSETIIKEKGRRLYTLLKVLFCAIAFFLVIFTVLANMGGNSQFHKETVEQFASESTGYKAKIGMLVNLTYFPSISVDFEDMDLFAQPEGGAPSAHIDKAQAAFSFWDVALHNGKIKVLNVQGIHMAPGVFLDKPLSLEHFSIVDESATKGRLEGQGYIGSTKLMFSMAMSASGEGAGRKYWFEPQRDISIELGDVKITGDFQNAINPYLSVRDLKISEGGKDVLTGRIDISKRREREVTIAGEMKAVKEGTVFTPNLVTDRQANKTTGTITSENFKRADFAAGSPVDQLVKHLVQYLGDPEKDAKILDDFFSKQDVMLDLKGDASYQGKLKFENNTLILK